MIDDKLLKKYIKELDKAEDILLKTRNSSKEKLEADFLETEADFFGHTIDHLDDIREQLIEQNEKYD